MSHKKLLSSYAWKAGDLIDAKWNDGYYYPGKVEKVNEDSSLVVLFDDGDISHRQRKDEVRNRKKVDDDSSSDSEIIIIPVERKKEKPEGIKEKSIKKPPKKEIIPKKATTPKKENPRKQNINWKEGDLIEAMWTDGLFYPAVIKRKDIDGQLKILFEDGVYRDIPVEKVSEGVRPRTAIESSSEESEEENNNNNNNNNNNQTKTIKEEIKELKKKASELNVELKEARNQTKKQRK
jgi:hypothetical protein